MRTAESNKPSPNTMKKSCVNLFRNSTLALLLLIGCTTTVTPDAVRDHQASFDGNAQNSGLIAELPDRSCVITPHARERYNALIEKFGARFTPPLVRDAGITATITNTFVIDAEHFTKF